MARIYLSEPGNVTVCNYPLKEEVDKKLKELDNKINKIARIQSKKAWTGSRKGKRR